jgi:hypothetical protein
VIRPPIRPLRDEQATSTPPTGASTPPTSRCLVIELDIVRLKDRKVASAKLTVDVARDRIGLVREREAGTAIATPAPPVLATADPIRAAHPTQRLASRRRSRRPAAHDRTMSSLDRRR